MSCPCGNDTPDCECYSEAPGCCGAFDRDVCRGCPAPPNVKPCPECEAGFIPGPTPDCIQPCDACGTSGWVQV